MTKSISGGLLQTPSLIALLERVGVTRSSVIRVSGASSLSALLWLCRHGFEQVGYVRAGEGCPNEADPDALIVAHTCNEIDLKDILTLSRQVRPGGALIFQLRLELDSSPLSIDWLLEGAGFTTEERLDGERRALIIARRHSFALSKAA